MIKQIDILEKIDKTIDEESVIGIKARVKRVVNSAAPGLVECFEDCEVCDCPADYSDSKPCVCGTHTREDATGERLVASTWAFHDDTLNDRMERSNIKDLPKPAYRKLTWEDYE